ncbi:abortive infection family protein (plasmid) [Coraliomargarita sp. W4R53]
MPINEDYVREERIRRVRKVVKVGETHLLTLHDAVKRYMRMLPEPKLTRVKGIDGPVLFSPPRADDRDIQIAIGMFTDEQLHKTYTVIGKWLHQDVVNLSLRDLDDQLLNEFQSLEAPIDLKVGQGQMKAEEQLKRLQSDIETRVAVFAEQLKADGEHEDITPSLRDAAGGWPHLRGIISDPVLDGYLAQMRVRRTKSQISAAIGAAKEVVEASIKHMAGVRGIAPLGNNSSLADWWRALEPTLESAKVVKALGSRDVGLVKLLKAQVNTIISLGELRNQVGTGHGKSEHPAGLTAAHALFAVDTAHTLTRYLTS